MLADDYFLGTKLYSKKFTELCEPLSNYLGNITSAHYVHVDKAGTAFNIYTLEKWGERVLEKEYYKVEVGIVHPDNMHNGMVFCESSDHQEYKDELLYDGAINFNFHHTFCYVQKDINNNGYTAFGFGVAKDNYKMANKLLNEYHIVKEFIRQIHNQLNSIIAKDLVENRVDVAKLKGNDLFNAQKGVVFNPKEEYIKKAHLLKDLGLCSGSDYNILIDPKLSPQEIHCLRSYLHNHSIKQVAMDLNLAETTVSSYMENIKCKLNCNNKHQLLEKGLFLESFGHI